VGGVDREHGSGRGWELANVLSRSEFSEVKGDGGSKISYPKIAKSVGNRQNEAHTFESRVRNHLNAIIPEF
jgi:hypothetical protein